MNKIKILHIQLLPILSGVQKVSLNILKNISDEKYEKWMLCGEDFNLKKPSLVSECKKNGVQVKTISKLIQPINKHDFRILWQIYKFIKKENFDIVHTNSSKTGFLGRIAAKLAGTKKIIHTVHGIAFHEYETFVKRQVYFWADNLASLLSDKLICVNEFYLKHYILTKDKTCIYNAVNYASIKEKIFYNEKLTHKLKIIFVGRLEKPKDPMTFIASLNKLSKKGYDFEAHIYGDGIYFEDLKKTISKLNLKEKVTLKGWSNNINNILKDYDLIVSSSIYEALPLTLLESSYCGIPAVATRVGGVPEVVIDGQTGFVVEPRKSSLITDKIIHYIENPKLLKEMGLKAKKNIENKFKLKKFINSYKKVYEE